jgi:hypothetical protein
MNQVEPLLDGRSKCHVLLIEPHIASAIPALELLQNGGSVSWVSTIPDALTACSKQPFDLIISSGTVVHIEGDTQKRVGPENAVAAVLELAAEKNLPLCFVALTKQGRLTTEEPDAISIKLLTPQDVTTTLFSVSGPDDPFSDFARVICSESTMFSAHDHLDNGSKPRLAWSRAMRLFHNQIVIPPKVPPARTDNSHLQRKNTARRGH